MVFLKGFDVLRVVFLVKSANLRNYFLSCGVLVNYDFLGIQLEFSLDSVDKHHWEYSFAFFVCLSKVTVFEIFQVLKEVGLVTFKSFDRFGKYV